MPKIAAATSSTGRPITRRPSNLVSSTETSTGTRKIRPTVSVFGRFIGPAVILRLGRVRWKFVMKAILLAGGKGTRLRPLTIHTPKPVVPIFDRAFLHYQIDLLRQVPEIDEVILSLNYQPRRIEEVFGDGAGTGVRLRYVVEPSPLGTGGAIRYAAQGITDTLIVFNGDVMTNVDVAAVVGMHRERKAKATIVLTPVDN